MIKNSGSPELNLPTEPKKIYFENLDGLRFILALVVFSSHSRFGDALVQLSSIDFINRLISTFSKGFLGVSCFFVLSGFLITYLMIEEKENQSVFKLKNFYIRRTLRIWPLYYSTIIFTFLIYPVIKIALGFKDQNPFNLIYQLTFLANFDSIRIHTMDLVHLAPMMININWSVSIEEQFYFGWPLLFLLFNPKRFWIGCLVVIFISWGFRLLTDNSAYLYYHTVSVISDLGVGAFFASLCYYNSGFIRIFERLNRWVLVLMYLVGILILMYSDLLFTDHFNRTSARVINSIFFSFIIVEQSYAKKSFFKFSNLKLLSSMGKYTYGLYMLHPIGIQTSIILFKLIHIDRDQNFLFSLLYSVIAFIVALPLAILAHYFIERKFLNLRKKFS